MNLVDLQYFLSSSTDVTSMKLPRQTTKRLPMLPNSSTAVVSIIQQSNRRRCLTWFQQSNRRCLA